MYRIRYLLAVGAACAGVVTACSHLPHLGGSRYDQPDASKPPKATDVASEYGCSPERVAANRNTSRLTLARAGTPICDVLGRYGDPISVSRSAIADMQLVSMLHREPNGRYINATFVYYDDTKVNRQLKRPVGKWIVDRITATR
jgi:hypothetical protein